MLTVRDLRRHLAYELKRTERQLHIFFSNAVLREDSKTLKEYGVGKRFGALCVVIAQDGMNHPSGLRLFKDFPTLEAADSKKDDVALDLRSSHYPFRHTYAKDLYRQIIIGNAPHPRPLAAQLVSWLLSIFQVPSTFLMDIPLVWVTAGCFAALQTSFRNLGTQPIPGGQPDDGIVSVAQDVDICRLWEMWFCPGEWGTFREWEWEKEIVCPACQHEIYEFFIITGLQIDR
jgi:hypothetical protein